MDDIEDRLRSHAQAFDGLLSLIPAKYYYGEDGSDQWKRKKQTKEEAREAKRAKLDPDAAKTAKDVMEENARKRKRQEDGQNEAASSEDEELGSEMPKEGLKRADAAKKQKQSEDPAKSEEAEAQEAKEAAKKEKQKEQQDKEAKTAAADAAQKPESKSASDKNKKQEKPPVKDHNNDDDVDEEEAEGLALEFSPEQTEQSSSSSTPNSPGFDASALQSGASSISSIVPPSAPNDASKDSSSDQKPLKSTPEELKQRLQKRLDELRAARHADGLNGKPARNRQELIEARRQKAEQRKAHKKELRQKAREEEQRVKDEALARRFSPGGSGSLLASPRSPAESVGSSAANYSFGRVVFADGQTADPSLNNVRDQPKRHGPHDPASALKAVEAKKARLDSMDDEKRAELEEKDMWLNAKKRAHGERVRDDTSLLKKALKRKESAKKKSEREWKERIETVRKGKETKQQKREDNLRKRREEKGNKGKKSAAGKKKARPGFEGSFKGKSGGKK
ncbi:putative 60S ribosome biogenesis protein Rrp14 [Aspergillus bombycis]|uniref:Putative 60S ribosome biogenesis protein Rrp14 n=1 Tax=Aspergillus bombycis TaxID=109264 RepID=A0A1F7ZTZ5_9EURO|nr:putative 60S ribosome biogenesis protein Rrp14 [Aspergillus bombycis]OGM42922.1 putative 60S ribosome biogenesis protein Rrp14 [Aspergillus bombycis]